MHDNYNNNIIILRMAQKHEKLFIYAIMLILLTWRSVSTTTSTELTNNQQSSKTQAKTQKIDDCKQLYPRAFYTQKFGTMMIKFNTNSICSRSYVTIVQNDSIAKFYCQSQMLKIVQTATFVQYIQNCLVTINTSLLEFNYTVYGNSASNNQIYENKSNSRTFNIKIPQVHSSFNMIVTADWGPLDHRPYNPIYPSLLTEITNKSRPIHGLLIIGDVAYDLSTNNCQQYEHFMSQLQAVSAYIPIIPILGNHESNIPANFEIFKKTFQSYNLTTDRRVQSYSFWNFKITTFNPFLQIYNISSKAQYDTMRNALFEDLKPIPQKSQFVVLTSHYPIICSEDVFHCQQTLKTIPNLFNQISQMKQVDLYLGAHMHQYERIAPYYKGNFTIGSRGPYYKGQMPSIVEGVAGCDVGIIDEDYPVQNFSIAHTFNQTGYGVLMVSNLQNAPTGEYIHYITPSGSQTNLFDSVLISASKQKIKQEE